MKLINWILSSALAVVVSFGIGVGLLGWFMIGTFYIVSQKQVTGLELILSVLLLLPTYICFAAGAWGVIYFNCSRVSPQKLTFMFADIFIAASFFYLAAISLSRFSNGAMAQTPENYFVILGYCLISAALLAWRYAKGQIFSILNHSII